MVYKTDEKGRLDGSNDKYLISGTPSRNQRGNIVWPLGTVVVQEQKAPTGYKVADSETYIVTISMNQAGDGAMRKIYDKDGNELTANKLLTIGHNAVDKTIAEPTIYGGVKGSKLLLSTRDKEVGNVNLAGIRFAVVNNSENDVVVDVNMDGTKDPASERFSRGQVVSVFTTDANGNFSSTESFMPHGDYVLYELRRDAQVNVGDVYETTNKGVSLYASPNDDGVLWRENRIEFSVNEENVIVNVGNEK